MIFWCSVGMKDFELSHYQTVNSIKNGFYIALNVMCCKATKTNNL
jgi:hypothetical protein